ncbi:MAG: Rieske 2Fe-2S domain-containing protein [Sphingomonadaceae bacterium]|nr:Rieske 2Fe-2S domain-containing protein [Sphingomonadaceae bacterium]
MATPEATAMIGAAQLNQDTVGLEIASPGDGGFDMNWWPVALSGEVGPEQIIDRHFLGGDVVIWRTASGLAQVSTAYCAHLGAHLGEGRVVGETIECAFHNWCFGQDGNCRYIPAPHDHIPASAKIFGYPTAEKWGIIWAFNGDVPSYEVPSPPFVNADSYDILADHAGGSDIAPFYAPISNIFDLQHFEFVHRFPGAVLSPDNLPDRPELDIGPHHMAYRQTMGGGVFGHLKVWGTNGLTATYIDEETRVITEIFVFATAPRPNGTGFDAYQVLFRRKKNDSPEDRAKGRAQLEKAWAAQLYVASQDDVVLRRPHFRMRNFTKADRWLKQFIEYVRDYPRADPGGSFQ